MVLAQASARHAYSFKRSSALTGLSGAARVDVLQLHLARKAPLAGSRSMMPNDATYSDADTLLARVRAR